MSSTQRWRVPKGGFLEGRSGPKPGCYVPFEIDDVDTYDAAVGVPLGSRRALLNFSLESADPLVGVHAPFDIDASSVDFLANGFNVHRVDDYAFDRRVEVHPPRWIQMDEHRAAPFSRRSTRTTDAGQVTVLDYTDFVAVAYPNLSVVAFG